MPGLVPGILFSGTGTVERRNTPGNDGGKQGERVRRRYFFSPATPGPHSSVSCAMSRRTRRMRSAD